MYFFLLVGAALIFFALRLNKKRKWLSRNGVRVTGVIIGQVGEEMNGRELYFPVVRIDDQVLGTKEVRLSDGTNVQHKVGSKIELVYHPADHDNISEYSDSMTMGHLVLLIVGIFFFLLSLGWITIKVIWNYLL